MVEFGEVGLGQADAFEPVGAPVDPVAVPLGPVVVFVDEVLHLHLLEFAGAEDEVARGDFVAERLAGLRDAEGEFYAAGVHDVLEIDKHALRRLGTQPGERGVVAQGADVGLEHHVEVARRGEAAGFAGGGGGDEGDLLGGGFGKFLGLDGGEGALDGFFAFKRLGGSLKGAGDVFVFEGGDVAVGGAVNDDGGEKELVGAVTLFAGFAVNERVGEAADVAGGVPDLGVHDDGRFDAHDVVAAAHEVVPPAVTDVLFEFYAERTVIEEPVKAAVDFGGRENEAAAFAERNNGFHEVG